MSITGGIKVFEKSKALLADGASIVVSSGEGTKDFALAGNQNRFLRTLYSGNLDEETFDVTFPSAQTIDRLLLRNHNFSDYRCYYWDGVQWVNFSGVTKLGGTSIYGIVESNYTLDTSYYEFTEVTTTKIRVAVTEVQDGGAAALSSQTFFAWLYDSKDGTWGDGVLTGTLAGNADIADGYLSLKSASAGDYVEWAGAGNCPLVQKGAIRIRYKPNYSGTPGSVKPIFMCCKAASDTDNEILFYHSGVGGSLGVLIRDNAGNAICNTTTGAWAPVAGTEYELVLTFNCTLGISRVYIDGVLKSSFSHNAGTRDANIAVVRVGAQNDGTGASDGEFRSLGIWNDTVFEPELFLYASFDTVIDADISKGDPDGVATGTVVISGARADFQGGWVTWDKANVPNKRFAVTFKYTPDYTGTPGSHQGLVYFGEDTDGHDKNYAALYHSHTSGNLNLQIKDVDGVNIIATVALQAAWAPTAGTTYLFEFQVDLENGLTKLFRDNAQLGATQTGIGEHISGLIRTGHLKDSDSGSSDFKINDFRVTAHPEYDPEDFPDVGAEKFINQIIPTKELGTFSGYPIVAGPTHYRNASVRRMLSGKSKVQKSEDSMSVKLSLRDYPANNSSYSGDVDLLFTLFDQDPSFLLWLCGGRYGTTYFGYTNRGFRLRDVYQMGIVGDYDMRYLRNVYKAPVSLDVDMVEVL